MPPFPTNSTWCFQVFSAIIIVTVAIVLKLLQLQSQDPSQNSLTCSSLLPSYLLGYDLTLQRLSICTPTTTIPDTTAVILNWSRLPNVVQIVNVLCDSVLENTLATVLVWNNSPQELTPKVCLNLIFHCYESSSDSRLVGFRKISMQRWQTENPQLSLEFVFPCPFPWLCAGRYAVLLHPSIFFLEPFLISAANHLFSRMMIILFGLKS